MNVAIPRSKSGSRPPFLAAIIGGTVLGVAAGVGIWQAVETNSSPSRPVASSASRSVTFIGRDTRTMVLYLVDTPEQALMVRAGEREAANERAAAGIAEPDYIVEVLIMATAQDEAVLGELLDSRADSLGGTRLIDYRTK